MPFAIIKFLVFLSLFHYIFLGVGCAASDLSLLTKTIVIKASRLRTPVLSPSIKTVSASQINILQLERMEDLLHTEPGLHVVQSGGIGQVSSVFFRGTNPHHLLVRIDGMRANPPDTASGSFDFADMSTQGIGTVEIIRGAVGSLYGTDAVGGMVNIQSEKGKGDLKKTVSMEGGTTPAGSLKASLQGEYQRMNICLNASVFHTDGFSNTPSYLREPLGRYPSLPYTSKFFNFRGDGHMNDRTEVSFFYRVNEAFLSYQENLRAMNQTRRQLFHRVQLDHQSTSSWEHQAGIGFLSTFSETDRSHPEFSTSRGQRIVADWQQKITVTPKYSLQTFLELEQEDFTSTYTSVTSKGHNQQGGIAFLQRWTPWSPLVMEATVRQDWSQRFTIPPCYRFAIKQQISPLKTEVFLSYGTAFKAPALFRLYGRTAYFEGNPDLKPEQVEGYEIGLKQPFGPQTHFTLIYFHNKLRQLVEYDLAVRKDINVARARTKGIETILKTSFTPFLDGEINYTLTLTRNEITGQALLRRPQHKIFIRGIYHYDQGEVVVEGEWIGKRLDVERIAPFGKRKAGSYPVFNIKANYHLSSPWVLWGRVENLLNRSREEPLGYCQAGITGYVGLKASF